MADGTYTLKGVFDVSDIQKGFQTISQGFKGLNFGQNVDLNNSISKPLSDAEKQITKITQLLNGKFTTKSDVTKLSSSFNALVSDTEALYRSLGKVEKLNLRDIVKLDGSAAQQVNDMKTQIEQLKTTLSTNFKNNAVTAIEAYKKAVENIPKTATTVTSKAKGITELLDTKQYEEAAKKMQALFTQVNTWASKDADKPNVYNNLRNSMQQFLTVFQDFNAQTSNIDIVNQIKTLNQEIDSIHAEKFQQLFNTSTVAGLRNEIASIVGQIDKLGTSYTEAAARSQELNAQTAQLTSQVKRFFTLTTGVQTFKRAVKSAVSTVKELDAALTETAIVSSENTVSSMWAQLPQYTKYAQQLGSSIKDVINAQTLYVQQGLSMGDSMDLAVETMKMARIAGMDAAEATDAMTAALRGFNMELTQESAQRINDVYSKLAQNSASNTQELSTAMSKVASIANSANMKFETTTAFLAQIINITVTCNSNVA